MRGTEQCDLSIGCVFLLGISCWRVYSGFLQDMVKKLCLAAGVGTHREDWEGMTEHRDVWASQCGNKHLAGGDKGSSGYCSIAFILAYIIILDSPKRERESPLTFGSSMK